MADALGILVSMQKNIIFENKTMVLFELPPCVFQPAIVIKGEKTPTFSSSCIEIFLF